MPSARRMPVSLHNLRFSFNLFLCLASHGSQRWVAGSVLMESSIACAALDVCRGESQLRHQLLMLPSADLTG